MECHNHYVNVLQNSRDNMSIVIVALPGAPKVDPEVAEKDRILNSIIEDRVRSNFNFSHVNEFIQSFASILSKLMNKF